jgi:hypothetical protein
VTVAVHGVIEYRSTRTIGPGWFSTSYPPANPECAPP